MRNDLLTRNIHYLVFQRNVFFALTFLLGGTLLVESTFLFYKSERIVVVPPVVDQEFWVDRERVSPSYLEQFGLFLGQMLLSKSTQSAPKQREVLLRHSSASFLPALGARLVEEEESLKQQNASYVFYPISVRVDQGGLVAILDGDKVFYIGGKQISAEKERYQLNFVYEGGRLLLDGVVASGSKNT